MRFLLFCFCLFSSFSFNGVDLATHCGARLSTSVRERSIFIRPALFPLYFTFDTVMSMESVLYKKLAFSFSLQLANMSLKFMFKLPKPGNRMTVIDVDISEIQCYFFY